jgi:hypothetical protein
VRRLFGATGLALVLSACQVGSSVPTSVLNEPPEAASSGQAPALTREITSTDVFCNIHAATTGKKGQTVPVVLTFALGNGCHRDPWGRANVDETTRTVTFEGATSYYSGDVCTEAVWYAEAGATFIPQSAGTYTLKAKLQPMSHAPEAYSHLAPPIPPERFGVLYPLPPVEVTLKVEVSE